MSGTATYVRFGNIVYVTFPTVSGTSNSTSITVNLPFTPNGNYIVPIGYTTNGGTLVDSNGRMNISDGSTTASIYRSPAAGAFSNSGTKAVGTCTVSYITGDAF